MTDPTWEEEVATDDLSTRLLRLERMAAALREQAVEEGRLSAGVERLGDSTLALTRVLTAVDEQAKSIARVDRKTEAVAFASEERAATAQVERRLFLRRAYMAAAGTLFLTIGAVIGGAWLTDKHLQDCVLHGPASESEQVFCNTTFPGHDHPEELSLDGLLAAGSRNQLAAVINSREGCERTQARVKIQVEKERTLAIVDSPATQAAHREAADELAKTLVDCDAEYPLPASRLLDNP